MIKSQKNKKTSLKKNSNSSKSLKKNSNSSKSLKKIKKNRISKIADYVKTNKDQIISNTIRAAAGAYLINNVRKEPKVQNVLAQIRDVIVDKIPSAKSLIGDIFKNQYTIQRTLGSGSFSRVMLGIDNITKKQVIIKETQLRNELIGFLLKNELRVLEKINKLGCKYTCCIVNYTYYNDNLYIVYSYDYTHTLLDVYNKPLINTMISKVIINLISGLQILHKNNIAHSDIKLENVIININNGDIKYIDFNLSCYNYCVSVGGSPAYMDPDKFNKFIETTEKGLSVIDQIKLGTIGLSVKDAMYSDIWSLGIVIYMIIYKKHPYLDLDNITEQSYTFLKYKMKIKQDLNISYDDRNYLEINNILRGIFEMERKHRLNIDQVYILFTK